MEDRRWHRAGGLAVDILAEGSSLGHSASGCGGSKARRRMETNQKGGGAKGMSTRKEGRGPTVNRRWSPKKEVAEGNAGRHHMVV